MDDTNQTIGEAISHILEEEDRYVVLYQRAGNDARTNVVTNMAPEQASVFLAHELGHYLFDGRIREVRRHMAGDPH